MTLSKIVFIIFIIGMIIPSSSLLAQEVMPIQTDRPNNMETAFVTPHQQIQGELGLAFEDDKPVYRNLIYPNVLIKYGVLKNTELRVSSTFSRFEKYTTQGAVFTKLLSPTMIGVKYNFLHAKKWIPQTALNINIGVPALASKQYQNDKLFTVAKILIQKPIHPKISINGNVGIQWTAMQQPIDKIFIIGGSYSVNSKLGVCAESYNYIANKTRSIHQCNVGLLYLLNTNIQLDLNGSIGLNPLAPQYYVGCGLSYRSGH